MSARTRDFEWSWPAAAEQSVYGAVRTDVEGIEEELDTPGEWYLSETGLLSLIPPAGTTLQQLQSARVEAPRLKTLVEFRGTAITPVMGVSMSGFNLTGAAQTFLDSYEAPSGGDWSVHRGGAVFLHGAVNISLANINFDQLVWQLHPCPVQSIGICLYNCSIQGPCSCVALPYAGRGPVCAPSRREMV